MRILASLISIAAVVPLLWFNVVPNGLQICTSSTPFAVIDKTVESQVEGAEIAKSKFCYVVTSLPM